MSAPRVLRFWRGSGRHRAEGDADTSAYRASFKPRHCAGDACFHDHAGESAVWTA